MNGTVRRSICSWSQAHSAGGGCSNVDQDGVTGREMNKQDPVWGSGRVIVVRDEVESHADSSVYTCRLWRWTAGGRGEGWWWLWTDSAEGAQMTSLPQMSGLHSLTHVVLVLDGRGWQRRWSKRWEKRERNPLAARANSPGLQSFTPESHGRFLIVGPHTSALSFFFSVSHDFLLDIQAQEFYLTTDLEILK